jgi:hypothetical protein
MYWVLHFIQVKHFGLLKKMERKGKQQLLYLYGKSHLVSEYWIKKEYSKQGIPRNNFLRTRQKKRILEYENIIRFQKKYTIKCKMTKRTFWR